MRLQPVLLAVGLLMTAADASPAAAQEPSCKQENIKKFFKKRDKWCSTEYAKGITAMTDQKALFSKNASAARMNMAKHDGGYYLVLTTTTRGAGDHTVRAGKDPLVFMFEDGTEIEVQIQADTSSRRISIGTTEGFCGFYEITADQLRSVKSKKVVEVEQFMAMKKDKSGVRLEKTKDGRTFYRWPLKLEKNQEELAEQAACVLSF